MVALAFSIIGFVACAFLIYVLMQFHRELARPNGRRHLRAGRAVVIMMPSTQQTDAMGAWNRQAS
jgi:uncharacterized membrane protein